MPEKCTGLFCDPLVIAGAIVLGLIVSALSFMAVRMLVINRARAQRGQRPLRFGEVVNARLPARELRVAGSARLDRERELQRQIEWENEQAAHELMRTGQHIKRQFCKTHDRWCYHAWEEGHPPGGFDNPTVPDDWPPDLRKPLSSTEGEGKS